MSDYLVFLDGVGQFAHNTALSVAAMCGNGCTATSEVPDAIFSPQLEPASHLSDLDTDYDLLSYDGRPAATLSVADHHKLSDVETEFLPSRNADAARPKAAQPTSRSSFTDMPNAVGETGQLRSDISDSARPAPSFDQGLSDMQRMVVANGAAALGGGYIFFGGANLLAHNTALTIATATVNRTGGIVEGLHSAPDPATGQISDSGDLTRPDARAASGIETQKHQPWMGVADQGDVNEDLHTELSELQETPLSRGGLTLSGGYSSIEGPNVEARIIRRNIGGRNREIAAAARYSKVQTLFEVGYADGNFLGGNTTFAPTLFANRLSATGFGSGIQSTPFRQSARGINLHFTHKLADGISATANYRLSDDSFRMQTKNAVCDDGIFGGPICGALGNSTSSILSFALTLDRRVLDRDTTRGFKLRLTQDVGIGGTADYARTRFSGEAHIGLGGNWSLSLDAEAGYMKTIGKGTIPLFDRFYIGDTSMRGFDLRGIGPKVRPSAVGPGQNIAIGGRAYYAARAELSVPIGGVLGDRGLRASAFVDAGSVFGARNAGLLPNETLLGNSAKPRVAAGVGLALNTPVGRLRLDFAKPLIKQAGDRTKLFSISFGAAI